MLVISLGGKKVQFSYDPVTLGRRGEELLQKRVDL